jgi:signal transduction histidine kinase
MHTVALDPKDDLDLVIAGAAHEFGNLLAVISNYATLAARRVDDPATQELLEHVGVASARAVDLARQLHYLSGPRVMDREPVFVQAVLRDAVAELTAELGTECTLELDLPDEPLDVLASVPSVELVLLQLTRNARQAMPDGGEVTIAARRRAGTSGTTDVEISVSDTGVGMSAEVRAHALEPLFTTRPKGQGCGLGLTIVDRTMRRLRGDVRIESVEGSGTTVRLGLEGTSSDG